MPDVGVLNLQIQDNSSKAAEGLNRLATALTRVKQAVGGGLKLGPIANQIKKLNDAVAKAIPEQSLANLERFANAIEKLNSAGGIKLGGLKDIAKPMDVNSAAASIKEQVETAVGDGFVSKSSREQETAVADLATSVQETVKETTAAISEVSGATDKAVAQTSQSAENTVKQSLWQMEHVARESTGHLKQFNPATGNFESTQYQSIREEIADFDKQRQESEAQWREQTLSAARELFANSSREVQEAVAHIHGMKVDELFPKAELEESASAVQETADAVQQLDSAVEPAQTTMKGFGTSIMDVAKNAFGSLKSGISNLMSPLTSLLGQFARIAKYRMLRAVLKHITEGFKEGVEDYYRYSQKIGSSFAPAMDSAATSLLQMKNSIGAAVAPLIQELIPYLQMAVSWFVNLVNYANQFLSLMRGQSTWSRATEKSAKAFDDVKKSAKGASASIKDLLADWDELNIIQRETDGHGGGGGSTKKMQDYLGMFEEVGTFDNKIKQIVDFIKENFSDIQRIAATIGTALLSWKLSNAFLDTVDWLSKVFSGLSAIATVALTVQLTDLTGKQFMKTGGAGWLIADALTGAVGSSLAKSLATKIAGATAGSITQGFTLVLSGLVNVKNAVSQATEENMGRAWMLNALGAIETGIGAGIIAAGLGATVSGSLAAGFIAAGVTFTIGAALIIDAVKKASYRKMAMDAFAQTGENGISTEQYLAELQKRLDELTKDSHLVIDTWIEFDQSGEKFKEGIKNLNAVSALIRGDNALTKEEAETFKENWEIVISAMSEMNKVAGKTVFAGLTEAIANGSKELKAAAQEARQIAIDLARQTDGINGAIKKEMEFLIKDITSGKATDEQIARYDKLYGILADQTEEGAKKVRKAIAESINFDFSQGEGKDSLENALSFINTLNANVIQPNIDVVKQQYESEIGALDEWRETLRQGYEAGYIKKDDYNKSLKNIDNIAAVYKARLDEQVKEIEQESTAAYEKVLKQVVEGIGNLDSSSPEVARAYAENIMKPIYDALEIAGYKIPDEFKATFDRMMNGGDIGYDVNEVARNYARSSIYQSIADTTDNGEVMSMAYELDLVGGDTSKITDETKKEIINSIVEVFGDMPETLQRLSKTFGWSMEDIVSNIDLSGWAKEEIEDLQDTLDMLGIDVQLTVNEGKGVEVPIHESVLTDTPLEEEVNITGKKPWTTSQLTGHAGASSGVRYADNTSGAGGDTAVVVTMDAEQQQGNIKSGVQTGTSQLLQVLQSLKDTADAINRKDFTVNITPTTMFGRMASMASGKFDAVTGNGP